MEIDHECEALRTPEIVCQPDPRSPQEDFFTREALTITYQHEKIAGIALHDGVPRNIWTQFETARNLYLYAWYVYRFYPVAEHQAYACLELALRERYEAEVTAVSNTKAKKTLQGLQSLLEYAIKQGHLKNEGFSLWRQHAEMRARERTQQELWEKARQEGRTEMTFDPDDYKITDVDRNHDYLEAILTSIPALRNDYAHGSNTLRSSVLGKIKLVSEIINQIYPALT
jgi:hypothetical protein